MGGMGSGVKKADHSFFSLSVVGYLAAKPGLLGDEVHSFDLSLCG